MLRRLIALSLLSPIALCLPAHAACDDNLSYMVAANGRCLNLTSLTNLGDIARQIEQLDREITPIALSNFQIEYLRTQGSTIVSAIALNQSTRSLNGARVSVSFWQKVDGFDRMVGQVEFIVGPIAPGTRQKVSGMVDGQLRGTPRIDSVQAI